MRPHYYCCRTSSNHRPDDDDAKKPNDTTNCNTNRNTRNTKTTKKSWYYDVPNSITILVAMILLLELDNRILLLPNPYHDRNNHHYPSKSSSLGIVSSSRSVIMVEAISLWSSSSNHNNYNNNYQHRNCQWNLEDDTNNNNNNNNSDKNNNNNDSLYHRSKKYRKRNMKNQQLLVSSSFSTSTTTNNNIDDEEDTTITTRRNTVKDDDSSLVLYVSSKSQSFFVPSTRGGGSSDTSTATVVAVVDDTSGTTKSNNNNMIVSLVLYVKDSIQQTIFGLGELYTNHQKCNTIRTKQKQYRAAIVQEWLENDIAIDGTINIKDRRKEYENRATREIQGGITYEDYIFLQNGKLDRGKVLNMAFLMFGAPRFLPYAIMFNKDNMLPSVFNRPLTNKVQQLIIERSYIVLRTLMDLEKEYTTLIQPAAAGTASNNNNFLAGLFVNKKKVEEQNAIIKGVYDKSKQYYLLNSGEMSSNPSSIVALLAPYIYKIGTVPSPPDTKNNNKKAATVGEDDYTRGEKNLCTVPKSIVRGVADAISGTSTSGILSIIQPHFLRRQKVLGHLQKIQQADDFLITANIDLLTIPDPLLAEACADRFISPVSTTELQKWLHCTVLQPQAIEKRISASNNNNMIVQSDSDTVAASATIQPTKRLYYNSNLARMALLVYYGCRGMQNYHSQQTTLPRLVLMGSGNSRSNGGDNE